MDWVCGETESIAMWVYTLPADSGCITQQMFLILKIQSFSIFTISWKSISEKKYEVLGMLHNLL